MHVVRTFRALLRVEVKHDGRWQGLVVRTKAHGKCEVHFVDHTPVEYYDYPQSKCEVVEQKPDDHMFAVLFEGAEKEVLLPQSELPGLVSTALLDLAWQHPTQAFSSIAKVQCSKCGYKVSLAHGSVLHLSKSETLVLLREQGFASIDEFTPPAPARRSSDRPKIHPLRYRAEGATADNKARMAALVVAPSRWPPATRTTEDLCRTWRTCVVSNMFSTWSKLFDAQEDVHLRSSLSNRSWKIFGPLPMTLVEVLVGPLGGLAALQSQLKDMGLQLLDSGGEAFLSTQNEGYLGWVHFDAVDSVLVVLSGKKVIFLAPPRFSEMELQGPARLAFATESTSTSPTYTYLEKDASWSYRKGRDGGVTSNFNVSRAALLQPPWIQVTATAGDLVFIPRGWLHAVDTEMATVAISLEVTKL